MIAVARLGQPGEPRGLEVVERRVGEVSDLGVVAGENDRVPGEMCRAPVVVQVIEVGDEDGGPGRVDGVAGGLPGCAWVIERIEAERRPGEFDELVLESPGAAVGEPGGR